MDDLKPVDFIEKGITPLKLPESPPLKNGQLIPPELLNNWLKENDSTVIIDLAPPALYLKQRIASSWFV